MKDDDKDDSDNGLWEAVTESVEPLERKRKGRQKGQLGSDSILHNATKGVAQYRGDQPDNQKYRQDIEDTRSFEEIFLAGAGSSEAAIDEEVQEDITDTSQDRAVQKHVRRNLGSEKPSPGSGLDRKTDQRLRRGRIPIEAQLDLHGYNRERAREALTGFLQDAYGRGKRCVLVITGKGLQRLEGEESGPAFKPGVIKRSLPGWLNDSPLKEIVLQFYPAQIKDGGEGACYIYLRRNKG